MHLLTFLDLDAQPTNHNRYAAVEASIFESLGDVMSSAILAVTQPLVSSLVAILELTGVVIQKSWSLNETSQKLYML